jgi:hypothetical protein
MKRKARRLVIKSDSSSKSDERLSSASGFGYEIPPNFEHVKIYFNQKSRPENAIKFLEFYGNTDWKTPGGFSIRNWKVEASNWIFDYNQSIKLSQRKAHNIIF